MLALPPPYGQCTYYARGYVQGYVYRQLNVTRREQRGCVCAQAGRVTGKGALRGEARFGEATASRDGKGAYGIYGDRSTVKSDSRKGAACAVSPLCA